MVFPVLYPEEDVRGHRLSRKQRQYIKGGELILVGPPRVRQMRVKEGEYKILTVLYELNVFPYQILASILPI